MAQPAAPDRQTLLQYEGTYEFPGGRRMTLGIFDEFNKSLVYLDLKTLKQGALVPIAGDRFRENNNEKLIFEFVRNSDGMIDSLKSQSGDGIELGRRVMPHVRRTVEFKSGQRTLRGDLYLPASGGKHSVVVFAHGSGPATRGVAFFTTYFLQLGIGVLTFDKQGAGESSGDWETASLDELSDDVSAAVDFARSQTNVDRAKVGILGNSQGGWVGTMAAAKNPRVSFLLMRVGAGESVQDTVAHEYKGTFMADGLSERDADEAVKMFREHWNVAKAGGDWEAGNAVIQKYAERPWFKKIYPEPRKKTAGSEKWWTWVRKNFDYDSVDYLKKIKIPVLWLMAEKDWNVNSQRSLPRILAALEEAKNKDHLVRILPGMAHSGLTAKTGYYNDTFSWQFAPGFWDTMAEWLKKRRIAK